MNTPQNMDGLIIAKPDVHEYDKLNDAVATAQKARQSRGTIMACRHTLDGHGYYVKIVESYRQYYTREGVPGGTDDGVNGGGGRGGKIAYCENCDRRLGRVKFSEDRTIIFDGHI